jgi:hypothetical protein
MSSGLGSERSCPSGYKDRSDASPTTYEYRRLTWCGSIGRPTTGCKPETATATYRLLAEMTDSSGTNWALGVQARSHALLSEGEAAETHYRESIDRLGRTPVRTDLARAHLLYGEWLRRQGRRTDAREQLRTARRMLEAMGMGAFAERARREVQATGETAQKRTVATRHADPPQCPVHRTTGPLIGVRSPDSRSPSTGDVG